MNWIIQPEQALLWCTRLAALGVLIEALESLKCWREFRAEGVLAWPWLRQRRALLQRQAFDWLFGFPVFLGLLALRGLGALLLLSQPQQPELTFGALLLVFIAGLLIHLRSFPYGIDGSHRLLLVIIGALLLQRCAPASTLIAQASLWFIALQACLSYATAGLAKLSNPCWRTGLELFQVLNTPALLASPALANFFAPRLYLVKFLSSVMLVMECSFPLVLLIGPPYGFVFLGWGILFHLLNAIVLGFNKFVWAWFATYPAILYVAYWRAG